MKRPASDTSSRHAGREGFVCPGCGKTKAWQLQTKALDLGVRRLRQTDFGDRRDDHAPVQAAADHLVLGGLSDGDPFQRHLGAATATPARLRLVQSGLAVVRQAAPQHGRARPQRARRPDRGRRDRNSLPQQEGSAHRRRQPQPPGQDAGRRRGRGRGRRSRPRPHPPRPRCPSTRPTGCTPFIADNLAPGATAKTDGWSAYPGAPGVTHKPHVVGKMAAHVVLPWVHRIFSNLKGWALGVYHGLRRKQPSASYLDEFVFRFNRRRTRHAAFRSLLGIAAAHAPLTLQDVDLTGSKGKPAADLCPCGWLNWSLRVGCMGPGDGRAPSITGARREAACGVDRNRTIDRPATSCRA